MSAMRRLRQISDWNSGEVPPNEKNVNWRGSKPRSMDTERVAFDMRATVSVWIHCAASSTERPSGAAKRRSMASRARSRSTCSRPPRKRSGERWPSTRSASVTVGSVPPRP